MRNFKSAVLSNQIEIDPLWGQKCLAYNLQFLFPSDIQVKIGRIQDNIQSLEPRALVRCPDEALHISILRLIEVRRKYSRKKEELWAESSEECITKIEETCRCFDQFSIIFNKLVVTDTAVILRAVDDGRLQLFREALLDNLPPIDGWRDGADIIHTTLFRFRENLTEPRAFISHLEEAHVNEPIQISCICLRKEMIYPSLESELLKSFQLKKLVQ